MPEDHNFDIIEDLERDIRKLREFIRELLERLGLIPPKPPLEDLELRLQGLFAAVQVDKWWLRLELLFQIWIDFPPPDAPSGDVVDEKREFISQFHGSVIPVQSMLKHIATWGTKDHYEATEAAILKFSRCRITLSEFADLIGGIAESASDAWIAYTDKKGEDSTADRQLRDNMRSDRARAKDAARH